MFATAATLALAVAPADANVNRSALAVQTEPVLNQPVFNDPLGQQYPKTAVVDQLVNLIAATQAGGEINLAMHQWKHDSASGRRVVEELKKAHDERKVNVKVILDAGSVSNPPESGDSRNYQADTRQALEGFLFADKSDSSWVDMCPVDRGCLAEKYLHNKFAVFSNVVVKGVTYPGVVFQSSSNLHDWYTEQSYNDAYTLAASDVNSTEYTIYQKYRSYFADLSTGADSGAANPGYYKSYRAGEYRADFYPHQTPTGTVVDPMVKTLQNVKMCSYPGPTGPVATEIRIAMMSWTNPRLSITEELARLARLKCRITVIGDTSVHKYNTDVVKALNAYPTNIFFKQCRPSDNEVLHTKVTMIKGPYGSEGTTPRVFTGSANFTALPSTDDAQLMVMGFSTWEKYQKWTDMIWSRCR
jgi:hypothetical protein